MYRILSLFVLLCVPVLASAQGLYVSAAGGISQGLGGATTAAPVDAGSALQWNPAAISGMKNSEVLLGGALLYSDINLTSKYKVDLPRIDRSISRGGNTHSDSGFPLISATGFVYKPDDSPFTFGMGTNIIAGASVNFPGDYSNPLLSPTGPLRQFTLGPIFASTTIIQITPTVSYQVTDRLAIGLGPTIDLAVVSFNPAFFATPDDANGDGQKTFPGATNARPFWGGGYRVGAYYHLTDTVDLGFGYTSKQYLERWRFHSRDEVGNPQDIFLQANLPAIYSWGIAYKGIDRWLFSLDLRYMDYATTSLFGQSIAEGGLNWRSIFITAVGAQYQVSDKFAVRAGYLYNQNPVRSADTLFNVQAPAITQHTVSAGFTYKISDSFSTSLAYSYGLPNSVEGNSFQSRDTGTRIDGQFQALTFGLNFAFGSPAVKPTRYEVIEDALATPAATPLAAK